MALKRGNTQAVEVWLGEAAQPVGTLGFTSEGQRESSVFQYGAPWLASPACFEISPDLPLTADRQFRKARGRGESVFPFAIADTEPDGWGCRVIARDHAKRRKRAAAGGTVEARALVELDYLLGVDDVSRVGALRLRDAEDRFVRATEPGERGTPPLLELADLLRASSAVERGTETEQDLRYLRGRGTSLGGLRPKCTVLDDDGHLAIGKFPSVGDDRAVTRAEVLALRLATLAGIDAAQARVVVSEGVPVALVRRFDRAAGGGRIPYLSATSMLQASREDDHSYTEIAERILSVAAEARNDLAELWRRIVFNMLITNVDDHLHNHGFLHVGHGQWRLAPAFDLNPFPDKDRALKTWLTEASGPTGSIDEAVEAAPRFLLTRPAALLILRKVEKAVSQWREVARAPGVGMTAREAAAFEPAFEHEGRAQARAWASRK